jgi:hypothetical protein
MGLHPRIKETQMTRYFFIIALTLFASAAFAQGPEPQDPTTSPIQWYASASGVLAATMFGVSMVKRLFGESESINKIPTWVFAAVIGGALTAFCAFVLGTLPGEPLQLIWQSIFNAASASGVYEWINHRDKKLGTSAGALTASGNPKKG